MHTDISSTGAGATSENMSVLYYQPVLSTEYELNFHRIIIKDLNYQTSIKSIHCFWLNRELEATKSDEVGRTKFEQSVGGTMMSLCSC